MARSESITRERGQRRGDRRGRVATGGPRPGPGKAPFRRTRTRFDWLGNLRQRRVAAAVAMTVALLFVISMFLGFGVVGFSRSAFVRQGQQGQQTPAPAQAAPEAASAQQQASEPVGNVLPSLPKFPPVPSQGVSSPSAGQPSP